MPLGVMAGGSARGGFLVVGQCSPARVLLPWGAPAGTVWGDGGVGGEAAPQTLTGLAALVVVTVPAGKTLACRCAPSQVPPAPTRGFLVIEVLPVCLYPTL